MQHTFLEQNPFYILEVSPEDKRALIISKAEEKAFFMDGNECEEAQAKLLNPEKRLYAEMDWFFGLTIEKTAALHNCINGGTEIVNDGLQGISCLNALLFNFLQNSYDDYFELGYAILEIDEVYSGIDQNELLHNVNAARQKAGIRTVSEDELAQAFGSKRNQIRQLISDKIAKLSVEDNVEFATMLAEKCIVDDEFDDGIIISDVIDQYEVRTQRAIEEATESILEFIEETKALPNYSITEGRIAELINLVKQWDRLVQPLQLKSMASGTTHESSHNVGREIHEFTVWLHNERDLSGFAITILDAMQPIFAEIGDLAAVFESDKETLSNILKNNREAEQLASEMEALKKQANSVKVYATSTNVNELIAKVKAINKRARRIDLEKELITQLRENICYIARDVAITLHNDKQQTAHALTIAKALVTEFSDIPSLKAKLNQDVMTLGQQIVLQARVKEQQEAQERAQKAKGIGCLVVIGIIILICLISGGLSQCGTGGSSEPYVFSQSADSGDEVYVDIVSIEPEYSISTQGSYTTSNVACRCKTSDEKTVWVYMSVYEYNKYIDPDAKLSNSFNAEYDTVRYSPAKRIYGKARKAESLCDGLSSKTATMILYFDSIK